MNDEPTPTETPTPVVDGLDTMALLAHRRDGNTVFSSGRLNKEDRSADYARMPSVIATSQGQRLNSTGGTVRFRKGTVSRSEYRDADQLIAKKTAGETLTRAEQRRFDRLIEVVPPPEEPEKT